MAPPAAAEVGACDAIDLTHRPPASCAAITILRPSPSRISRIFAQSQVVGRVEARAERRLCARIPVDLDPPPELAISRPACAATAAACAWKASPPCCRWGGREAEDLCRRRGLPNRPLASLPHRKRFGRASRVRTDRHRWCARACGFVGSCPPPQAGRPGFEHLRQCLPFPSSGGCREAGVPRPPSRSAARILIVAVDGSLNASPLKRSSRRYGTPRTPRSASTALCAPGRLEFCSFCSFLHGHPRPAG
jgi:hypothetical protein